MASFAYSVIVSATAIIPIISLFMARLIVLLHQSPVSKEDSLALVFCTNTLARYCLESMCIRYLHFPCLFNYCRSQGMFRMLLNNCCKFQCILCFGYLHYVCYLWLSFCQRSSLVKYNRVNLVRCFQGLTVLYQYPIFSALASSNHYCSRRSKA